MGATGAISQQILSQQGAAVQAVKSSAQAQQDVANVVAEAAENAQALASSGRGQIVNITA